MNSIALNAPNYNLELANNQYTKQNRSKLAF